MKTTTTKTFIETAVKNNHIQFMKAVKKGNKEQQAFWAKELAYWRSELAKIES